MSAPPAHATGGGDRAAMEDLCVSRFQGVTGADLHTSRFYLEANNWDTQRAILSFFDATASPTVQFPQPDYLPPQQQQPSASSSYYQPQQGHYQPYGFQEPYGQQQQQQQYAHYAYDQQHQQQQPQQYSSFGQAGPPYYASDGSHQTPQYMPQQQQQCSPQQPHQYAQYSQQAQPQTAAQHSPAQPQQNGSQHNTQHTQQSTASPSATRPVSALMKKIGAISDEVDIIERRRHSLGGEVQTLKNGGSNVAGDSLRKDVEKLKKNCMWNNEELMRRLEALDGLSVSGDMEARAARKELVNRIQAIMRALDDLKDQQLEGLLANL